MKGELEQAQWSICVRLPRLRLAMTERGDDKEGE